MLLRDALGGHERADRQRERRKRKHNEGEQAPSSGAKPSKTEMIKEHAKMSGEGAMRPKVLRNRTPR